MYFTPDKPLPVLSFIGRPLDPVKGFMSFLNALEILLNTPRTPNFMVWIIGGDEDELPKIASLINSRRPLKKELEEGRIIIWGKVKREALPDFYKRSFLTVMPSLREPFGLVAIESMACGTPVIGSSKGGIADTVLPGITGALVEEDSPNGLVASILLYLRNPELRIVRGKMAREWADSVFSKSQCYGEMAALYTSETLPLLSSNDWELPDKFSRTVLESKYDQAENLLGEKIERSEIIYNRYHITSKIQTRNNTYALKLFKDRPSLATALLPIGAISPERTAEYFVENSIYHQDNSQTAKLLKSDIKAGIAIFEWLEISNKNVGSEDVLSILRKFSGYSQVTSSTANVKELMETLGNFLLHKDIEHLRLLDLQAIKCNKLMQGSSYGTRKCHPVAELVRISFALESGIWPITSDITSRLSIVLQLLIQLEISREELPKLCHGDAKIRHFVHTNKGKKILDTEHSSFAFGELDLAILACSELTGGQNLFNVIKKIDKRVQTSHQKNTALQWMFYFLVYGYLARIHHGNISVPDKFLKQTLIDFSIALV